VYSILAIELLIHFNSITGVYDIGTTGQIIPLVIGLATLWKTAVAIFAKFLLPEKSESADDSAEIPNPAVGASEGSKTHEVQYLETGVATVS